MKKISAILISLLFVVSTFGVASIMAQSECPCEGGIPCPCEGESPCEGIYKFDKTTVRVGETFTVSTRVKFTEDSQVPPYVYLDWIDSSLDGYYYGVLCEYKFPAQLGLVKKLKFEIYDEDGNLINETYDNLPTGKVYWVVDTFQALKPGIVDFRFLCFNEDDAAPYCYQVVPVKITSSALPMLKFMKILGLGNTD